MPDGMDGRKYESLSYVAKAALLSKEKLSLAENIILAQCVLSKTVRIFGSVTNVYPLQRMSLQLQEGLTLTIVCIWKNSNAEKQQNCRGAELEKEQEDKRQLQKQKASLPEQLAEDKVDQ